MTCYSVQPEIKYLQKVLYFCLLRKKMSKNIGKKLSSKYWQKFLNHAKQSAKDAFKNDLKRAIQKTAESAGDLIENKIADRITKDSPNNTQKQMKKKKYLEKDIYLQHKDRKLLMF